jgi:hypothetical protein
MVDIDAAVGFVVARGDAVDRARLSSLRTGVPVPEEVLAHVESGQSDGGGWPAQGGGDIASVDATCFRLAEIDDLGGLHRPAAIRALDFLANRQRRDGFWEEDASLADSAPPWARPGDPEARFYLTANAGFWLAVASGEAARAPGVTAAALAAVPSGGPTGGEPSDALMLYSGPLERANRAIAGSLGDDGGWPGFLISGWLAAAVLYRTGSFYESAQICSLLRERVPGLSAADAAWMVAALRRAGVSAGDPLIVAGQARLSDTQRSDGAWPSDDGDAFDMHTTLTALRALL